MKFSACLDHLEKNAGLLEAAKNLALTEVPGTKPWLIRPATAATSGVRKAVRPAASSVTRNAVGPKTYDVSALARQMGIK